MQPLQAPQGDSAALQLSLQATFRDLLAELVLGVILLVDTIEIAPEVDGTPSFPGLLLMSIERLREVTRHALVGQPQDRHNS